MTIINTKENKAYENASYEHVSKMIGLSRFLIKKYETMSVILEKDEWIVYFRTERLKQKKGDHQKNKPFKFILNKHQI